MSTASKSIFPAPPTSIKHKCLLWNWIRRLPKERALHWQGKQVRLMRHGGLTKRQSLGTSQGHCPSQRPSWVSCSLTWAIQYAFELQSHVCHPHHGGEKQLSPAEKFFVLQLKKYWMGMYPEIHLAWIIHIETTYVPIWQTTYHHVKSPSYTECILKGLKKSFPFSYQLRKT